MLRLILFRHGKSDRSDPLLPDRERPLTRRGIRAARAMGRFLASAGQVPELALSSPARRAADTLALAMEAGDWSCPSRIEPALYTFEAAELMGYLPTAQALPSILLITGHQPALGELAGRLIGAARLRFPTAAMARIDLPVARWGTVAEGSGELRWLVPPKLLSV
ncbi:MAG: histidine phosphatase family protein [Gammaproteobacteria bacterium]|nr:MAG: histidine phosphatase family protein [Gammaproteobacteria bacterium]